MGESGSTISTVCQSRKGINDNPCLSNGYNLPSCWYDIGVQRRNGDVQNGAKKRSGKWVPVFIHYSSSTMFCMPCCPHGRSPDFTTSMITNNRRTAQQKTTN